MKYAVVIIALIAVLLCLFIYIKIKNCILRVKSMSKTNKIRKINELAEPFGFYYIEREDIFSSRKDAWQRKMGYDISYDYAAPMSNMVIDSLPVYFDYDDKTWLIELWKGQYGITMGGEVGIYHAKKIVAPEKYVVTHYDAVNDFELPYISCRLMVKNRVIYDNQARHWWLTGFKVGKISNPKNITLLSAIHFENQVMAKAFYDSLVKDCPSGISCKKCTNIVYVNMAQMEQKSFLRHIRRLRAQICNHFLVRLYLLTTFPFKNTYDKILFLYYMIPRCARRILSVGGKRRGMS